MNRDEYLKSIEAVFIDQLKKAAIRAIVTKLPFFALPIANPILCFIISKILDKAAKEAEIGIYFLYIDLRTNAQANKFSELALKYDQQRTLENETLMLNAFYKLSTLSG